MLPFSERPPSASFQFSQNRDDGPKLKQPGAPPGLRLSRVSNALDQVRLAIDKRLADCSPLLIVEFEIQVVVPGPARSLSFEEVR